VDPRAARLGGDVCLAKVDFLPHAEPLHELPRALVGKDRSREYSVVAAGSENVRDQSTSGLRCIATAAMLDAEPPADLALLLAVKTRSPRQVEFGGYRSRYSRLRALLFTGPHSAIVGLVDVARQVQWTYLAQHT
jgi:hypothetical protein